MLKELELIGKRIKRTRQKRGLSQAELAESLKISTTHISEIERGRTNCGLVIFKSIAEILNISADWLLLIDSPVSESCSKDEMTELLKDCNQYEYEIIFETAKHLKKTLSTINNNQNYDSK